MEVAESDFDAPLHALSKAYYADAFQRRFLAGSFFLFRLFQMDQWIKVEKSVAVLAMDSLVKKYVIEGAKLYPGLEKKKSHCEPSLLSRSYLRMAHIHYDKSSISPSYREHHFGLLKYDINHTLVVLLSTIGCVECNRGQKYEKKSKS